MIEEKNLVHQTFRQSKFAVALLATTLVCFVGTFFLVPRSAHAQMPVTDAGNLIQNTIGAVNSKNQNEKEFILDPMFYGIARVAIQGITDSVVRWINSGFQGGPAFVTNPDSFFTGVADEIAGTFIEGTQLGFLCEPFGQNIRIALNYNYSQRFRISCTLSDVLKNTENFAKFTKGDFSQGGWDGWYSMTQNPNNNPYGAYAKAQNELTLRVSGAVNTEYNLLNQGGGFLSWRECEAYRSPEQTGVDASGNPVYGEPECAVRGDIQTPGSVIEGQLENVLGSGVRQLELADEFNEIVGALMGQLVQKVLVGGLSHAPSVRDNSNNNNINRLTGFCESNEQDVIVGENVTWSAQAYGGTEPITYSWSGDAPLAGLTGKDVTIQYTSRGKKFAKVRLRSGNQSKILSCGTVVTVRRDQNDIDGPAQGEVQP